VDKIIKKQTQRDTERKERQGEGRETRREGQGERPGERDKEFSSYIRHIIDRLELVLKPASLINSWLEVVDESEDPRRWALRVRIISVQS